MKNGGNKRSKDDRDRKTSDTNHLDNICLYYYQLQHPRMLGRGRERGGDYGHLGNRSQTLAFASGIVRLIISLTFNSSNILRQISHLLYILLQVCSDSYQKFAEESADMKLDGQYMVTKMPILSLAFYKGGARL